MAILSVSQCMVSGETGKGQGWCGAIRQSGECVCREQSGKRVRLPRHVHHEKQR